MVDATHSNKKSSLLRPFEIIMLRMYDWKIIFFCLLNSKFSFLQHWFSPENLVSGRKQVFKHIATNMQCFKSSLLFTSFSEVPDSLSVKKAKCLSTKANISLWGSKNYTARFSYYSHNLFSEEVYTYVQARTITWKHESNQIQIYLSPTLELFQHCPFCCLGYLAAIY